MHFTIPSKRNLNRFWVLITPSLHPPWLDEEETGSLVKDIWVRLNPNSFSRK